MPKRKKNRSCLRCCSKRKYIVELRRNKTDLIQFICDAAPSKQGKFTPGSNIPILQPSELKKKPTDYLIILPWNIAEEIKAT